MNTEIWTTVAVTLLPQLELINELVTFDKHPS